MANKKFGELNIILGCMFSSKTSTLISRYKRYQIGGKKCIMIKYKFDTRYDNKCVITHDGIKIDAIVSSMLYELDKFIKDYDVICIDEIQFYKDADIFCDKWANDGKIVEVCGLNGDYKREPFEIISKLIPMADNILFLKAVCKESGEDAVYSNRLIENDLQEVIGGEDMYNAVSRKMYFSGSLYDDYMSKFSKFINLPFINIKSNKSDILSLFSFHLKEHFMFNRSTHLCFANYLN